MRKCKCKQCNLMFKENDTDINIHYRNPSDLCHSCIIYNLKEVGDFYQSSDGSYHQKTDQTEQLY